MYTTADRRTVTGVVAVAPRRGRVILTRVRSVAAAFAGAVFAQPGVDVRTAREEIVSPTVSGSAHISIRML